MSYGVDVYANKATPVVKDRSKWANAGPAGEAVKDLLETEDAVVAAIENGAETYEELYASINANVTITGYDVDEVGDLFDEFNASLVSDGYA
jgi:phage-related minor tail protein